LTVEPVVYNDSIAVMWYDVSHSNISFFIYCYNTLAMSAKNAGWQALRYTVDKSGNLGIIYG